MKKFYVILAAIAALSLAAQAQNYAEVNVGDINDATTYNGSYFDMAPTNFYLAHTGVQMLYTPDMFTDMNGKQNIKIKLLNFWFYSESFEEIIRDVKIYLQEVDATEFAVNDEGVKQFFEFGEPVKEMTISYDLLNYYGENVSVNLDFEPFDFNPSKSLLVTMVFDAQDDDNCTMGSDYAPFYTSGIRSKAMTYTNNWTSFVDFAAGNDFPNATAMLGCGTNVELPVTTIGYNYEDAPVGPTEKTADPNVSAVPGDQCYTITITNNANDPDAVIYVRIDDGEYEVYEEPIVLTEFGEHWIYTYAQTDGKLPSNEVAVKVTIDENTQPDLTAVNELNGQKTVAGVRYFNMAGQEMQQAEGLTIVVTTYTDGTSSAVKVMK